MKTQRRLRKLLGKRSEWHCGAVLCSLCADAALRLVAKLETPEQSLGIKEMKQTY